MLQVNTETGTVEAGSFSGEDNQKWVYIQTSEGDVTLENVGTTTTYNWIYDTKQKTLMNVMDILPIIQRKVYFGSLM